MRGAEGFMKSKAARWTCCVCALLSGSLIRQDRRYGLDHYLQKKTVYLRFEA